MKCRAVVRLISYDAVVLTGTIDDVPYRWLYVPRYQYEKIRTHLSHKNPGKALAILRKYRNPAT
jgi:hypothetical protein